MNVAVCGSYGVDCSFPASLNADSRSPSRAAAGQTETGQTAAGQTATGQTAAGQSGSGRTGRRSSGWRSIGQPRHAGHGQSRVLVKWEWFSGYWSNGHWSNGYWSDGPRSGARTAGRLRCGERGLGSSSRGGSSAGVPAWPATDTEPAAVDRRWSLPPRRLRLHDGGALAARPATPFPNRRGFIKLRSSNAACSGQNERRNC